jgi:hypothetical protein
VLRLDDLIVGQLIWWSKDQDWGASWNTPGRIESVDWERKEIQVFTYDTGKTTTVRFPTDPATDRDSRLHEMRVVGTREVERYLQDRMRSYEDRATKAQRALEDAEDAVENWKKTVDTYKATL